MMCADYREHESTGFVAHSCGGNLSSERTEMQEQQVSKRAGRPGRKRQSEKHCDRAGVACADCGAPCQPINHSVTQTRASENTA